MEAERAFIPVWPLVTHRGTQRREGCPGHRRSVGETIASHRDGLAPLSYVVPKKKKKKVGFVGGRVRTVTVRTHTIRLVGGFSMPEIAPLSGTALVPDWFWIQSRNRRVGSETKTRCPGTPLPASSNGMERREFSPMHAHSPLDNAFVLRGAMISLTIVTH